MTFNTGNNVPSTDPRDLYDNAENLDKLVNGADPFYADRKGVLRESWAGMENTFDTSQAGRENAFALSQSDKESRFQAFLVSSGYVSKGDYAAGVVLAERNEYVAVNATTTGTTAGLYRPGPGATLPLTLTGTWATDSANLVLLGDDVLRQELATGDGSMVAFGNGKTLADLAGASGALAVGYERSALADAITTVGGMLSAQWRNVWEYAALAIKPNPLDISTWDWQPAIQAAVNDLPQVLYFPPLPGDGVYYTESAAVVDDPMFLIGTHSKRGNTSGGTRIENRGTGDCITYSDTKVIYDAGIKNLGLTATAGGSPLRIKYGAVRCQFTQLYLYSKATNRPCVSADFTVGTLGVDFAGMFSCVFDGGEYIVDNLARTAGIIDMFANATVVNENEFKNIWLTQSNGRAAIRLFCTVNGPLLTNNRFSGLTFEICSGGLIHMQGTSHTKISGCSGWDMKAGYDGSLILVSGDTTKSQNRGLLIENFARVGNDPLNGAAVDIHLGYSRDTTIINHSPNASLGAIIDAASRTAVIIGTANATVNNGSAVTYLSGSALSTVGATIRGILAHTGTQAGFFGKDPVNQPTALPNTSGATLVQIEGELNTLKQKLRDVGLLAI